MKNMLYMLEQSLAWRQVQRELLRRDSRLPVVTFDLRELQRPVGRHAVLELRQMTPPIEQRR